MEVTNGIHAASLFICDVNLERIFDRDEQFNDVQAHMNPRYQ
jgi:hypothetical protein